MQGRMRWLVAAIVGASFTGGLVGLTWATSPGVGATAVVDLSSVTGVGESLVVVVAGSFPDRASAEARAQELTLGDMQGFYVDSADNYELLGIYDQSSPDLTVEPCRNGPPGPECPPGVAFAWVFQPIHLVYVPRATAAAYVASGASCGDIGQPPCMMDRVRQLLTGPDLGLAPGGWLVVTAFRTLAGAEEFVELTRSAGYPVAVLRLRKLGGPYVGLGQEAHPDGISGPLLAPLPNQEAYQE
ncbi:MAG TPA: hypothetical protein VNO86_04020 [Candidatus Binatia bacterium]|nr:hypothetical protein [Candidatus Binatia bacterium]